MTVKHHLSLSDAHLTLSYHDQEAVGAIRTSKKPLQSGVRVHCRMSHTVMFLAGNFPPKKHDGSSRPRGASGRLFKNKEEATKLDGFTRFSTTFDARISKRKRLGKLTGG